MRDIKAAPGPTNSLLDVGGIRVGQAHDSRVITGTTLVIPDEPVAMAVDVRGGGPGTRETDALDPDCLVERVHALVLSGGSVFGLAAADRVAGLLSANGIGIDIGVKHVPVVPAAILFDLQNGGDKAWDDNPYTSLADKAFAALDSPIAVGSAGAGYGARAGSVRGGLGTASFELDDGTTVGALVAVNSFGDRTKVAGGEDRAPGHVVLPKLGIPGTNTTLAVVATNLDLDKARCHRLAIMAHDGLARALSPLHTPFDGDTVFALSTHKKPVPDGAVAATLAEIGALAADALVVAVRRAIDAAASGG